jgi:hypothetical protein
VDDTEDEESKDEADATDIAFAEENATRQKTLLTKSQELSVRPTFKPRISLISFLTTLTSLKVTSIRN